MSGVQYEQKYGSRWCWVTWKLQFHPRLERGSKPQGIWAFVCLSAHEMCMKPPMKRMKVKYWVRREFPTQHKSRLRQKRFHLYRSDAAPTKNGSFVTIEPGVVWLHFVSTVVIRSRRAWCSCLCFAWWKSFMHHGFSRGEKLFFCFFVYLFAAPQTISISCVRYMRGFIVSKTD